MAEKIVFENSWISNYEGQLTLTLDRIISRRPPPTCQISLKSNKLFVEGQTAGRTHVWTDGHLRPALLSRLCQRVDLIISLHSM